MHPNPLFRDADAALCHALVEQIGFGMVFAQTPDGPRVAHTPLLITDGGSVLFHLSRGNALAKWLDGTTALVLVNGPDAYVSPRWYEDQAQVPTWNYVSVELEGPVRRMDSDSLLALLEDLGERQEQRIEAGEPWTMDNLPPAEQRRLLGGIVGFAMEIQARRPTFKLSQNKPEAERRRVAQGLEAAGSPAMAELMRGLVR